MKRKFLSVLLSLAMLLSLLPASALAVDLTDEQKDALLEQGYTEEEIAELEENDQVMVITEDTELTEDFDGLVLIMNTATVTIKGAKVGLGVVVMTGVENVKVVLAAGADVNAVIVLEKAEIIVEEDAQVTFLTVAAAETTVTVAGSVTKLTIDENANDVEVNVAETGTVEEFTDNSGSATLNDESAKADEDGEDAEDEDGEDAEDAEDNEDESKDNEDEAPAEAPAEDSTEDSTTPTTPVLPDPDPIVTEPALNIIQGPIRGDAEYNVLDVIPSDGGKTEAGAPIIDVKIVTDVKPHESTTTPSVNEGGGKAWVGLGIPKMSTDGDPVDTTGTKDNAYKYTLVMIGSDGTISSGDLGSSRWNSSTVVDGETYSLFWLNAQSLDTNDGSRLQVLISKDWHGNTINNDNYEAALKGASWVLNLMVAYTGTTGTEGTEDAPEGEGEADPVEPEFVDTYEYAVDSTDQMFADYFINN